MVRHCLETSRWQKKVLLLITNVDKVQNDANEINTTTYVCSTFSVLSPSQVHTHCLIIFITILYDR